MSSPPSPPKARSPFISLALGAFLLLICTFFLGLSAVPATGYYGGETLARKENMLDHFLKDGPVDTLVVGSSFMDVGFDAGQFTRMSGKRAFNMGITGTDAYWQARYLMEVLIPRLHPNTVIFGLRESTRTRSGINHQYLRAPVLRFSGFPFGAAAVRVASWLPQYRKKRLLQWAFAEHGLHASDLVDEFGMTRMEARHRQPQLSPGLPMDPLGEGYDVPIQVARSTFESALRSLRRKGIHVLLLMTPYTAGLCGRKARFTREVLTSGSDGFAAWMTRVAKELDIPILNLRYCSEISPHRSLFFDATHLNSDGAERLAQVVARTVQTSEVPERYSTIPSKAERRVMLGTFETDGPVILAGESIAVRALACTEEPNLGLAHVVARVHIKTAGTFRIAFSSGAESEDASYLLLLGGSAYRIGTLPMDGSLSPETNYAFEPDFALEAGTQPIEVHSRNGVPIPSGHLVVVRSSEETSSEDSAPLQSSLPAGRSGSD